MLILSMTLLWLAYVVSIVVTASYHKLKTEGEAIKKPHGQKLIQTPQFFTLSANIVIIKHTYYQPINIGKAASAVNLIMLYCNRETKWQLKKFKPQIKEITGNFFEIIQNQKSHIRKYIVHAGFGWSSLLLNKKMEKNVWLRRVNRIIWSKLNIHTYCF